MTRIERLYAYSTINFFIKTCCNEIDDLFDKLSDETLEEIVFTILESDEMNER